MDKNTFLSILKKGNKPWHKHQWPRQDMNYLNACFLKLTLVIQIGVELINTVIKVRHWFLEENMCSSQLNYGWTLCAVWAWLFVSRCFINQLGNIFSALLILLSRVTKHTQVHTASFTELRKIYFNRVEGYLEHGTVEDWQKHLIFFSVLLVCLCL